MNTVCSTDGIPCLAWPSPEKGVTTTDTLADSLSGAGKFDGRFSHRDTPAPVHSVCGTIAGMSMKLSSIEARWSSAQDGVELWVDGRSVIDLYKGPGPEYPDGVSPFSRRWLRTGVLEWLQGYRDPSVKGNEDLPAGVLELAVCSQCADWQCGSFSVRLKRDGDYVEWSSPDWAAPDMDDPDLEVEPIEPGDPMSWFPPRLTFRADEYDAALDQVAALMEEHPWPIIPEVLATPSRLRRWFSRQRN